MMFLLVSAFLLSWTLLSMCCGSPLVTSLSSCPQAISEGWDELTEWDKESLKLTLDIGPITCEFDREVEVDVFAVKQREDKFACDELRDEDDFAKFFAGRDSSVYVLSAEKTKITFEFISGRFVFRIGKKSGKKFCTGIKSYNKGIVGNNNSALYYKQKCSTNKDAEMAPRQPSWNKNICSLEIPTFQLPKCYLITNYTKAPVYLIQIDDENKTCAERGDNGELNPSWKNFDFEIPKKTMLLNKDTQLKDIRFTDLEEDKNYCIFISMWETYPICNRDSASVEDHDVCYFFSKTSFRCPPRPQFQKLQRAGFSPTILVSSCGIILVICVFFIVKFKRKTRIKMNRNTVMPLSSTRPGDEEMKNCKIYLLYYPNQEVTQEDIKQVVDQDGSLCKNLYNICSTDTNVTIIDIVDKIRLDEIQETSEIELELCSGVAKCVLILTPSAKQLFDHIASGGNSPNPLDRDQVDGSVRNVILPIFKHVLSIQNINVNTYQTIGCVRFDRNDSNDGDEIKINPLVRMSLPSDGREFAEWAIHNS